MYRWYAELFYYNPKNFTGRRGAEPIGHLTQLLWASSNAIGCARTQKLIKDHRAFKIYLADLAPMIYVAFLRKIFSSRGG